jgi:hypothetical protein
MYFFVKYIYVKLNQKRMEQLCSRIYHLIKPD